MSQTLKNILIFGALFIMVLFGYYIFANRDAMMLSFTTATSDTSDLLSKTQVFITRRADLESRLLDTSLFSNERFTSLRSYHVGVPEQTLGRRNIFDSAVPVPVTRTQVVE